jgi:hypothetical protein
VWYVRRRVAGPRRDTHECKEQIDQEELSLADNEEILHALSELSPIYENGRSYFVLGNDDREPIRRLNWWTIDSTVARMATRSGW